MPWANCQRQSPQLDTFRLGFVFPGYRTSGRGGLFVPGNLAAIVAKVVREVLPVFGHSAANPTNPPALPAQVRPYPILFALGVVRHEERV